MADVKLDAITRRYGGLAVLNNLSLDLSQGEFAVIVGPSGCGKTTLLRMIAGLEPIDAGQVIIDGQVMNDIPPGQRDIAMVFQSYALYPHMSVYENMAYALKIAKRPKPEIDSAVRTAADALRITPYLERLPGALSVGQRQRVAIGRAIVRNPRLFLFDEPLSNLDASLRASTRGEIAQLKAMMPNTTMIYVTHDQTEAMTLADRIVVLTDQGIVQVGAPMELYARPQTEFVAQFIGTPAMNLLPGRITSTGSTTKVALAGEVPVDLQIPTSANLDGAPVTLGVRPEDLQPADKDVVFTGGVQRVEVLGDVSLLYVTHPEVAKHAPVIAKWPGDHARLRGETLSLGCAEEKRHLFHKGIALRRPATF